MRSAQARLAGTSCAFCSCSSIQDDRRTVRLRCYPLSTKELYRHQFEDLSVVRGGRSSHEYLVQRLFLEGEAGNSVSVVEVPTAMAEKTAFAHFGASRVLMKTPRELGHGGLCVVFHKYDRALQNAMGRLSRQFQAAWGDTQEEQQHAGKAFRLWITNWWFCVGCFAHDVHGSLKWSILNYTHDQECMRSVFFWCTRACGRGTICW